LSKFLTGLFAFLALSALPAWAQVRCGSVYQKSKSALQIQHLTEDGYSLMNSPQLINPTLKRNMEKMTLVIQEKQSSYLGQLVAPTQIKVMEHSSTSSLDVRAKGSDLIAIPKNRKKNGKDIFYQALFLHEYGHIIHEFNLKSYLEKHPTSNIDPKGEDYSYLFTAMEEVFADTVAVVFTGKPKFVAEELASATESLFVDGKPAVSAEEISLRDFDVVHSAKEIIQNRGVHTDFSMLRSAVGKYMKDHPDQKTKIIPALFQTILDARASMINTPGKWMHGQNPEEIIEHMNQVLISILNKNLKK